jgi:hypothetical protein
MTTNKDTMHQWSFATSAATLSRLADTELSLPRRLAHVALLLAALSASGVIGALWATEPALPLRTQVAFAVLILIGLSWVVFALWVLTSRSVLPALHRVVASRMAVLFSIVFIAGALAVGTAVGGRAPFVAAVEGVLLLAVAVALLIRANRQFVRLTKRRQALQQELGGNIE